MGNEKRTLLRFRTLFLWRDKSQFWWRVFCSNLGASEFLKFQKDHFISVLSCVSFNSFYIASLTKEIKEITLKRPWICICYRQNSVGGWSVRAGFDCSFIQVFNSSSHLYQRAYLFIFPFFYPSNLLLSWHSLLWVSTKLVCKKSELVF